MPSIFTDRALLVSILGLFLPAISQRLGIQLSADKIAGIVIIVASYLAHNHFSLKVIAKDAEAKALAAVTTPASSAVAKLLVLALGLTVLAPTPARAQSVLASAGPTLPLMEVRPANLHPVSLAAGAGLQVSLTLPSLQKAFGGKAWDLLDLTGMAFGTDVSGSSGATFGALSVALGLCTMSSLVCVGAGHDLVTSNGGLGGWFGVFALNFNFALAPSAPPAGVEGGAQGLPRGNTLYFGAP